MNKKILAAFLCVCMVVVTGSFPVSAAKTKKTYKIAIDAGHQGKGNSKTEPIGPGAKMRKQRTFAQIVVFALLLLNSTLAFAQNQVNGIVTDKTGEPLIGVNVVEKGRWRK